MTETSAQHKNLWQRLSGPLKVGLIFAGLGIVLTVIGIFRDTTTPVTTWSLIVGCLISGITWGLVSWAMATAAVEVENDVSQVQSVQQPDADTDDSN